MNTRRLPYSFPELQNSESFRIQDEIREKKFEAAQIHSVGHVFIAVAIVVADAPYLLYKVGCTKK